MHVTTALEAEVSDRFRIPAPTRLSSLGKAPPVAFSRLRSDAPIALRSKPPRPEDAYVVHVLLAERADIRLWLDGRQVPLAPLTKGAVLVGRLESKPIAGFDSAFDVLRFYVGRAALDEMADGAGLPRPQGLRAAQQGACDPILYHLAAAVAPLTERSDAQDQLLVDHVAVAFQAHLLGAYGGAPQDLRPNRSNLAPWQERRAKAFIDANLARNVSLSEIAETCRLSASHFSRAFRNTTGRPPHRWMLERRIAIAKQLLAAGALPLGQIATDCGFADACHFSRVFARLMGEPPAAWRRTNRPGLAATPAEPRSWSAAASADWGPNMQEPRGSASEKALRALQ